jgi:hypothetical protein
MRRPAHSAQRRTGQAVGAPQRPQSGGAMRGRRAEQAAQSDEPGAAQATQRWGSRRSRKAIPPRYGEKSHVSVPAL